MVDMEVMLAGVSNAQQMENNQVRIGRKVIITEEGHHA